MGVRDQWNAQRVSQRKLWGIVSLARKYPRHFVDAACERALAEGVYSYNHVKALAEQLVTQALATLEATAHNAQQQAPAQAHELIRDTQEYGDLFAQLAAGADSTSTP